MKHLLPLLLLCACAGSLVDHAGVTNPPPDSGGGGLPPTQQCIDTCTTAPQGATPSCNGDVCTYVCNPGLLRTPLTQSCSVPSAIAAGGNHTCAIAGGQVLCWGANGVKELGVEAVTSTGTPVQVPDLPAAADQITASTTQTCVHLVSEAVWCWGAGQAPHPIAGIPGAVNAIAAGAAHACAATGSGVWCWGDNASGQLGVVGPASATPVQASNVPGSKVLAAGTNHTCAGDTAGSQLWCWGANDAGQNGTGGTSATSLPAAVQGQGASGFFVAAGEGHTCSITSTGSLSCWGANGSHQVDGSTTAAITSPKGELSGASAATGGAGHTCAVQGGAMSCWGLNDNGQLDTGDFVSKTNPARTSLVNVGRIAAGSHHTCALLLDSSLKCWGANDVGQLGSGTISGSSTTPVDVTGR
jgi:alpha-tubulin suppressor-like RCC1 family protein